MSRSERLTPIKKGAAGKQCTFSKKLQKQSSSNKHKMLMNVEGAIRKIVDYIQALSNYPQPMFSLIGAICMVSALINRQYTTTDRVYANLYANLLGPTGCGKDASCKANKNIADHLDITDHVIDTVASGPGIEDYLSKLPSPFSLIMIDEFGKAMEQRKAKGDDHGVTAVLLRLFSAVSSFYTKRIKASDSHPEKLDRPFVTLLGLSTPETFLASLSQADAESGLLGRMIFIATDNARPQFQSVEYRDDLLEEIASFSRLMEMDYAGSENQSIKVDYSAAAKKRILKFQAKTDEFLRSDEINKITRELSVRIVEMVKKLSLIRAVSRSPLEPLIEKHDIAWAITLMSLSHDFVQNHLALAIEDDHRSSSDAQRIKKCLEVIANAKTYRDSEFIVATKQGFMPKRLLQKKMNLLSKSFHSVVSSLLETKQIAKIKLTKAEHGINCKEVYYLP